ncbi:NEK5 [Symbiodinium natans]|uniref:NEK5 protein n=1 Tax=Symbiodinium natans TaxID=878477 RepID=A0A812PKJ0_9DINO|nr:NEK5 [Symbiodinium natans]
MLLQRANYETILVEAQDSQKILMKNLQALLNYQTQYILWALGTVLTPAPTQQDTEEPEEVPEASTLLAELQQVDFEHMKGTSPRLSREILHWHQAAGQELYDRIASLTVNVSKQSWPLRMKAARGMLHHFQASFRQRLKVGAREPPMADKLQWLREDTAQQRKLAGQAEALQFKLGSSTLPAPLVEALIRCHEKHSTYTMLHSKAMRQMDAALAAAHNFTRCDADTKALHEAWQLAVRAEERSQEVLIEAWATTVAAAEHLLIAFEDEQLLLLLKDWAKDVEVEVSCQNTTALALQSQVLAAAALDRAAWSLTQQVITFQALASYQDQQLKQKHLEHVALPDAWEALKVQLAAAADPGQPLGQRLATVALQALGSEFCPAPNGCARGILVDAGVRGAVPCEHAGDSVHVLPKRFTSQLVQEVPLRPQSLRSLALVQLVEDRGH